VNNCVVDNYWFNKVAFILYQLKTEEEVASLVNGRNLPSWYISMALARMEYIKAMGRYCSNHPTERFPSLFDWNKWFRETIKALYQTSDKKALLELYKKSKNHPDWRTMLYTSRREYLEAMARKDVSTSTAAKVVVTKKTTRKSGATANKAVKKVTKTTVNL
jgi:aspartyl-tRNA synthetase